MKSHVELFSLVEKEDNIGKIESMMVKKLSTSGSEHDIIIVI